MQPLQPYDGISNFLWNIANIAKKNLFDLARRFSSFAIVIYLHLMYNEISTRTLLQQRVQSVESYVLIKTGRTQNPNILSMILTITAY